MSKKFEQLLDLIVNEEMDKANELFHEIVVEKSRNIYENLIAEESQEESVEEAEDEEQSESVEDDDTGLEEDEVEESMDEDELEESDDVEESMDEEEFEEAYMADGDEEEGPPDPSGLEKTDKLGGDVGLDGDAPVEDQIRDAIEQLEAALANMDETRPDEFGDEEGMPGDDVPTDSMPSDEKMGMPMEGKRRMTREYTENVGMNWEKGAMKTQKQHVAAGTGDTEGAPQEGKSPIASGSNKPGPAGVNAKNLNQGATEGQSNTGTSPGKVSKGLAPHSGEKMAAGMHNVDGKKSGVKTLTGVKGGHGAEKKGSGPGPVGSGTGDKAGQTSTPPVKPLLKPYSK